MIKRQDIIKGLSVSLNEDLVLVSNKTYEDTSFPKGSIFMVSYLSLDKYNPKLTLKDKTHSYTSFNLYFDELCKCLDLHLPASEHYMKLHEKKLNQIEVLKKIKKIAAKDDLNEVLNLVDKEYFKSIKNVKTLMMYAIKSKGLKILQYGFVNNWFKKIDYNDNVAIGATVATPLYYAILKSTQEVQHYLIEQGASVNNKHQKYSKYTIKEMFEYMEDSKCDELIEFEKIVHEKEKLEVIKCSNIQKGKIAKI